VRSTQVTTAGQPVQGNAGNYSEQISPSALLNTTLAPGTTVYYAVHLASDTSGNGNEPNYYSAVVQSTVGATTSVPPITQNNIWVYSADGTRNLRTPIYSNLKDFFIVLQRRPIGGRTEYRLSVLGDNAIELDSAIFTISRGPGVDLVLTSPQVLVYRNVPGILQHILAGDDNGALSRNL
jgi:hypothetical protein